jgi:hypothetical protein
VALDPYGVGAIVDALAEVGISGQDQIVGISQGWKLTGAIKTAERKLADGSLRHGGHRLMSWAVGNARVEPKGNAIIITKQASGPAKIDPLMAAFNAIRADVHEPVVNAAEHLCDLSCALIDCPTSISRKSPIPPTWAQRLTYREGPEGPKGEVSARSGCRRQLQP